MARKSTFSVEALEALGAAKLAALVHEEAQANAAFKRRATAALAGSVGPEAIAKLIDQRLAQVNRSKGYVAWNKAVAYRDDLAALLGTITRELASASPKMAAERLLRFLATNVLVTERVDDTSGRLQGLYDEAIAAFGQGIADFDPGDASQLIDLVMELMGDEYHGCLLPVTEQLLPRLSPLSLRAWEADLARRFDARWTEEAALRAKGHWFQSMTDVWREGRQMLLLALGDLDAMIALEMTKPPRGQDSDLIARLLRDAGRLPEALTWVRRKPADTEPAMVFGQDDDPSTQRSLLEADILMRMGAKPEAIALLLARFDQTLAPPLLRALMKALPDFDDIEAEAAALSRAMAHPDALAALQFFQIWKRPDLAAELVIRRRKDWKGSDWHILPTLAESLEPTSPLAATILYRALLDDILARARSKAYPHAARYWARLEALAPEAEATTARPDDVVTQAVYEASVRAAHGRKAAFWYLVEDAPDSAPVGRKPSWYQLD